MSLNKHSINSLPLVGRARAGGEINALGSKIVREIVIPELTKEVNENKNFAQLRQVYNSLILATWYKKKIKDSILEQVYANKNKIAGVEPRVSLRGAKGDAAIPKTDVEYIYQRYLHAFKKGVYNYIKEDVDPLTQETIPRKYFSGGMGMDKINSAMIQSSNSSLIDKDNAMSGNRDEIISVNVIQAQSLPVFSKVVNSAQFGKQLNNLAMKTQSKDVQGLWPMVPFEFFAGKPNVSRVFEGNNAMSSELTEAELREQASKTIIFLRVAIPEDGKKLNAPQEAGRWWTTNPFYRGLYRYPRNVYMVKISRDKLDQLISTNDAVDTSLDLDHLNVEFRHTPEGAKMVPASVIQLVNEIPDGAGYYSPEFNPSNHDLYNQWVYQVLKADQAMVIFPRKSGHKEEMVLV